MRILLDTHALLYWLTDLDKLSRRARALLESRSNAVYVSAVSAYEIGFKYRIGKLPQAAHLVLDTQTQAGMEGFIEQPVTMQHARLAAAFDSDHRDPFDRLLAAQALIGGLALVSNDTAVDAFGVTGIW